MYENELMNENKRARVPINLSIIVWQMQILLIKRA